MTAFVPAGRPRFAHQKRGLIGMIKDRGVHALLFDPGTGKTATTLDYASLLALKSPTREARVLVIAPLAAVDTWVEQAEEFVADGVRVYAEALGGSIKQKAEVLAARRRHDFRTGRRRAVATMTRKREGDTALLTLLSVNLDSFSRRDAVTPSGSRTLADVIVDGVRKFEPDLVVIDESHRIKGPSSNTSKAIARLARFVPRRVILTGTLMPHSPLDVFAQWRFLHPTAFGKLNPNGTRNEATFGHFRGTYAVMGGWMGKEVKEFVNLDQMQDIIALNSSVAKKEDALDLPPVTDTEVTVHLSAKEQKAYDQMKSNLAVAHADGSLLTAKNRLGQLMRLRQITSGFLPDDAGNVVRIGDSKAQVARSIAYDNLIGENRIVVFAHFRPEIDLLADVLQPRKGERPTEVVTITGDTKAAERKAIRARFGSDDPARIILIAQIKTMSLAVNELVTASHAIFASLPNERDDITQARARLDRQGQKRPVTLWTLLVPRSVDSVIIKSYRDRTNLESAMLQHILDND